MERIIKDMKPGKKHKRIRKRPILAVIATIMGLTALVLLLEPGVGSLLPGAFNAMNGRDVSREEMAGMEMGNGGEAMGVSASGKEEDKTGTRGVQSSLVYAGASNTVGDFAACLEEHIAALEGHYGIYFADISSGLEFGINENDEFFAASTVKVPLALYLAMLMEEGIIRPDKKIEYTAQDYETGCGRLQYEEFGSRHTILDLIGLSVRISDNVATNMLLGVIGYSNLKDFMRSMGGRVVDEDRNVTCPRDMALYMLKVYDFSQKSKYGEMILNHLENTVFNERIPALLPKDVRVAHKIGNWPGSYHDVGIVFTENSYVIAIMSDGVDEGDAYREIAGISRMFFDFFS